MTETLEVTSLGALYDKFRIPPNEAETIARLCKIKPAPVVDGKQFFDQEAVNEIWRQFNSIKS